MRKRKTTRNRTRRRKREEEDCYSYLHTIIMIMIMMMVMLVMMVISIPCVVECRLCIGGLLINVMKRAKPKESIHTQETACLSVENYMSMAQWLQPQRIQLWIPTIRSFD